MSRAFPEMPPNTDTAAGLISSAPTSEQSQFFADKPKGVFLKLAAPKSQELMGHRGVFTAVLETPI
jgi:hypothetical protein